MRIRARQCRFSPYRRPKVSPEAYSKTYCAACAHFPLHDMPGNLKGLERSGYFHSKSNKKTMLIAPYRKICSAGCTSGPPIWASGKVAVFCFPCSRCQDFWPTQPRRRIKSQSVQLLFSTSKRKRHLVWSQRICFDRYSLHASLQIPTADFYFHVLSVADHDTGQH